jgi:hypothetical protein
MSKSNDISNIATLEDHHPLADSELDAVSGGWLPSGIPGAEMYAPSVTSVTYVSETINGRRIQK